MKLTVPHAVEQPGFAPPAGQLARPGLEPRLCLSLRAKNIWTVVSEVFAVDYGASYESVAR